MPTTVADIPEKFRPLVKLTFGEHLAYLNRDGSVDFIWDAPETLAEVNRLIVSQRYANMRNPEMVFGMLSDLRNRLSMVVATWNAKHPSEGDDGDAWGESLSEQ